VQVWEQAWVVPLRSWSQRPDRWVVILRLQVRQRGRMLASALRMSTGVWVSCSRTPFVDFFLFGGWIGKLIFRGHTLVALQVECMCVLIGYDSLGGMGS